MKLRKKTKKSYTEQLDSSTDSSDGSYTQNSESPEKKSKESKERSKLVSQIRENYLSIDHPTSFGGIGQVKKFYSNISKDIIEEAIFGIDAYTLQRPKKRPRHYNPIFVRRPRQIMQCDLIIFDSKYNKANDGFINILVLIDSFTRFVWVRPLKDKTGYTVRKCFSELKKEMHEGFGEALMTDQGTEFINKEVKEWLKENDINLIKPNGKCPTVERFNQTFQNMIYKYLEYYDTIRYIDVIQKFSDLYNNEKYHRIIKMTPAEAEKHENKDEVLENLEDYYDIAVGGKERRKPRFKIGDLVRVSRYKKTFDKGYHRQFVPTVYRIKSILNHLPIPMYKLVWDSNGKKEEGTWYGEELQKVDMKHPEGLIFKGTTEKTRQRKGFPKEKLINYTYWPNKYSQWQFVNNIEDFDTVREQFLRKND